jgi:hypothetical protein
MNIAKIGYQWCKSAIFQLPVLGNRIRIHIKVKTRIRIRMEMKSMMRICIKNTKRPLEVNNADSQHFGEDQDLQYINENPDPVPIK